MMNFIFLVFLLILVIIFSFKSKNILYILPVFYITTCLYSVLGINILEFAVDVPFDLYRTFDYNNWDYSLYAYLLASISFIIGVHFSKKTNSRRRFLIDDLGSNFNKMSNVGLYLNNTSEVYKLIIILVTLTFLWFGYGVDNLVYRVGYVPEDGRIGFLLTLYTLFLPISSFILAFVKSKTLRYLLLIVLFFSVFGTTARMLLIIPVLYYVGVCLKYGRIKYKFGFFIFCVTILVLTYTLEYRNHAVQGIIPNVMHLFHNGLDLSYVILGLNYVLSFSFAVNSYSLLNFSFNPSVFLIAINPLPSTFLDMGYMIDNQSLNANAPIPALSYLFLGGTFVGCSYYLLVGFFFSIIFDFVKKNSVLLYVVILALFLLFVFFSGQYNLRSVTRITYYIIILGLCLKFYKIIVHNIKL
ncbi:TPA: hypothetical protein I7726_19815 [Vibrio vulnificus]|nr:hypothetical protein [Vibrio vulnificus]